MALYTIADLHLSSSASKPMDKFGSRWTDHAEKLRARWTKIVRHDDTVMIPGDISWGMDLSESLEDFRFIDSLPGRKIISKGNHDFWWCGVTKMNRFLLDAGVTTIEFLSNSAVRAGSFILAGTRGWFIEEKQQNTIFPTDYEKLVNRETIRLGMSLDAAEQLRTDGGEIIVFLHFPPLWGEFECTPILTLMLSRGVKRCYFGHIHGAYNVPGVTNFGGLELRLVSADYLNFTPLHIPVR